MAGFADRARILVAGVPVEMVRARSVARPTCRAAGPTAATGDAAGT